MHTYISNPFASGVDRVAKRLLLTGDLINYLKFKTVMVGALSIRVF